MVREPGKVEGRYGATMGSADEAGRRLLTAAVLEGMGSNTEVHAVGDGATWIAEQVEKSFGAQGRFLIDFYHLCDYLAEAAKVIHPQNPELWLDQQKKRLKEGLLDEVMQELRNHMGSAGDSAEGDPVRACRRYLQNRPGQFQYKEAIETDLPIGSGEIESAHRHVLQQRLKLPGAWWKPSNAEHMVALRVCRANNQWNSYWQRAA